MTNMNKPRVIDPTRFPLNAIATDVQYSMTASPVPVEPLDAQHEHNIGDGTLAHDSFLHENDISVFWCLDDQIGAFEMTVHMLQKV